MLPPISSPVTNNGVTFSSNDAGEYVLTGTATANAYCNIFNGSLPAGTYTINGLTGASSQSYRIRTLINGTAVGYHSIEERTITVSESDSVTIQLFAYPAYGAFSGLTLRYQLESGSVVTDWTPYSNICPISGRTGLNVYKVGHELISIPQYSETKNGCTLTVVDESTIRISGTPSSEVRFIFPLSTNTDFEFNPSTMRFYINDSPPTGISLSVSGISSNGRYQNFNIRVKTTFGGDTVDLGIHIYAKDDESNVSEAY